jgi:hypothetical protein
MSNDQIESAAREIYEFRWGLSLEAIAAILHKHLGRGEGERDRLTQKELERLEAALLRELSALRQRVGELEGLLVEWSEAQAAVEQICLDDDWSQNQHTKRCQQIETRLMLLADQLAAARQAGEGRTK